MYGRIAILFSILSLITAEIYQAEDVPKNSRMVGVDTVHDVNIDKDTVITRNAVLPKKSPGKQALHGKEEELTLTPEEGKELTPKEGKEPEPDWSYSNFPKEVSDHVHQFKKNMTECLKEVQARDRRPIKRLSPKTESPVHGECLIACVLKRNAVIQNGKINKENLITLVSKFYAKDTKLMKKLEKNVDRCIDMSIKIRGDECALASQLNSCTNDLMASNKHKIVVNYK